MPTRSPPRLLVVAIALGSIVAACGDDDPGNEAAGTTGSDLVTTTSSEPTTTMIETKGDAEWFDVARGLYTRYADLLASPDPDRVSDLYAETCTCWDEFFGTVEFLAAEGDHIAGQPTAVLHVTHEQTDPATGLVDLTVKGQAGELRRVDRNGTVVEEYAADEAPGCTSFSIRPDGPGDAYRIYSETPLSGCPDGM